MFRTPPSTNQLCIYLLGAFRIELKTQSIRLPTRKTESLLAYLILHSGSHSREKLAALFWGESSDTAARGSLRKALALLRKYIDSELILADRETVRLDPSFPLWADVNSFEIQAQELLAGTSLQPDQFTQSCYQGDLLSDFYDDWIFPLREHYRALYLAVLLRGVEQARAQSDYQLAIEHAQKILEKDAANERAHQHLMFCYMTLGDRNKALEQYDACQCALQDELDVEPTRETQALYTWIKHAGVETPSLAARVTNLPIPISSFVGRNRELSKIKQLLSNARLVTLTGAGGSGKTRLAIHAATDLIDSFKDGVWWVELAPLTEPSLVPSAVAKSLGIDGRSDQPLTETLKQYLRTKRLLLVLDNCEHLIESCAHLAESLLTSCADLKILTTSRESLCLSGENVWLVPPLSLPEVKTITLLDLLMEYEGVRLFIERASAINPEFTPSNENAMVITQICQRLDGIPLAIELAAARIRNMSVEQISAGLDDRFQLLTASTRTANVRHQTLHAAIDWSYNLLSETERLLFCRFSVFSGGWTLDAAEAICSGEGIEKKDIPDLLGHLVDKSLLSINVEGQRYGVLETIRQYASEKLIESGLEDLVIQKHLDYFLRLAETADEKIRGSEQLAWLKRLEAERDNLIVALKRSASTPIKADTGGRLVNALCWYWYAVGDFIQIQRWMESVFYQSESLGRTATRAKVLFSAGAYSAMRVKWLKPAEAYEALEESLDIWHDLGTGFTLQATQSQLYLGYIEMYYFTDQKGIDHVHECIEIFKKLENYWWQAWALGLYEMLVWNSIDYEAHRSILEEGISLWEKVGDRHGQANVLLDMGKVEQDYGKFAESEEYLKKSLSIFKELKAKGYIQKSMKYIGDAALGLKNYDQALKHYEESVQLAHRLGQGNIISYVYHYFGYATLHTQDDQRAEKYFHQALEIDRKYNYQVHLVWGIVNFAFLAAYRGSPLTAARLFGAFYANIEALQVELGLKTSLIEPLKQLEIDHFLGLCKTQIDTVSFDQAWNEGRSLSLDDALSEILKEGG